MSRNSITPSRAFLTIGDFVDMTGGWPSGRLAEIPHSPGDRTRRSWDRPSPQPGTCGNCRRSTAARGSRSAEFGARRLARLEKRVLGGDVELVAVDDELGHRSVLIGAHPFDPLVQRRHAFFNSRQADLPILHVLDDPTDPVVHATRQLKNNVVRFAAHEAAPSPDAAR